MRKQHAVTTPAVIDQIVAAYSKAFPQYMPLTVFNHRIFSVWMLGAAYARKSNYYGSYPGQLKERILSLFPNCHRILHLFSGTIRDLNAVTFDIDPALSPTICDDVRNIGKYAREFSDIDLVVADPPYEDRDFKKYGVRPFNKPQVIRDLAGVLKEGTYLAWLDTYTPMYNTNYWECLAYIAVIVSTNTRVRMLSIFQRINRVA